MKNEDKKLSIIERVFELDARFGKVETQQKGLEERFTSVLTQVQGHLNRVQQALSDIHQQYLGLEHSALSLGKIVTSLSEVMIEKNLLSDAEVSAKLRSLNDRASKDKLDLLKAGGLIEPAELATEESLVVLEMYSGEEVLSKHQVLDMSTIAPEETEFKAALVGHGVGAEAFLADQDGSKTRYVLAEIYQPKSKQGGEEAPAAQEGAVNEA